MEFTGINVHGGDVQLYGLTALPEGERKVINDIPGRILARGETSGHCHVLTGDVEIVEIDGQKYACVGNDGAYHQHYMESRLSEQTFTENRNISDCDHVKPCWIPPGNYRIGLDQQYDPTNGTFTNNKD